MEITMEKVFVVLDNKGEVDGVYSNLRAAKERCNALYTWAAIAGEETTEEIREFDVLDEAPSI